MQPYNETAELGCEAIKMILREHECIQQESAERILWCSSVIDSPTHERAITRRFCTDEMQVENCGHMNQMLPGCFFETSEEIF